MVPAVGRIVPAGLSGGWRVPDGGPRVEGAKSGERIEGAVHGCGMC